MPVFLRFGLMGCISPSIQLASEDIELLNVDSQYTNESDNTGLNPIDQDSDGDGLTN